MDKTPKKLETKMEYSEEKMKREWKSHGSEMIWNFEHKIFSIGGNCSGVHVSFSTQNSKTILWIRGENTNKYY